MDKYIHNISGSDKSYMGTEVVNNAYYLIPSLQDLKFRQDDQLLADIAAGDAVMSIDGVVDLSLVDSQTFLAYDGEAFDQRFRSEPERSNAFSSKNVQDAIEECRISAIGTLLPYSFIANGNTADKWLSFSSGGSAPSNEVPMIIPQGTEIKGMTFSNSDDDVDIDVCVYINGTLEHTWEVRNKRVAWNVGAITIVAGQGDRISVYLKKYTGGSGDSTAQNPTIALLGKIVTEGPANTGIQYGL